MKESNFVLQLKKSFAYQQHKSSEALALPLFWKLRGSAATSGRPDILIVDQGFTFFIETKVKELKRGGDVLPGVTALQRANLHRIVANGGLAYICIQVAKDTAIGVDLRKYYEAYGEMPTRLNSENVGVCFYAFVIRKEKNFWNVQEFHERNMK